MLHRTHLQISLNLLLVTGCSQLERTPAVPKVRATDTLEIVGLPHATRLDVSSLASLGAEDRTWSLHGETHVYRCIGLHAVLAHCGLDAGAGGPGADPRTKHAGWRKFVVAHAADGFDTVFSSAELMPEIGPSQVWIAWAKNGAPMAEPEGPLRLLVPTDKKGSRSIRQLVRIDVRGAADAR